MSKDLVPLGDLYRYVKVATFTEVGKVSVKIVKLKLIEFAIRRKTPCGYWVYDHVVRCDKRWISNSAINRFAYQTKKEALFNFIKRSEKHIELTEIKLKAAKQGLAEARRMYDNEV